MSQTKTHTHKRRKLALLLARQLIRGGLSVEEAAEEVAEVFYRQVPHRLKMVFSLAMPPSFGFPSVVTVRAARASSMGALAVRALSTRASMRTACQPLAA